MQKYFIFFALILAVLVRAEIDLVKNLSIKFKPKEKTGDLEKRALEANKADDSSSRFPEEISIDFEAFGKEFELNLKRNDNLLSSENGLKIEDLSDDPAETNAKGVQLEAVPYIGTALSIKGTDLKDSNPFARFLARIKPDGSGIALQGGFEWENNFFKLTPSNHPSIKYHVDPDEISLLKRATADDNSAAMEAKRPSDDEKENISEDLIISKESMDPRKAQAFGHSFNAGTKSKISYRCGHDDAKFNNDPQRVSNDFVKKLAEASALDANKTSSSKSDVKSIQINPLTAQYYMAKRSAGNPSESGCPAERRVLYIGVAADSSYLAKFDGNRQDAVSNILNDFNLVSAIYEKAFNIEIGIVSITILNKAAGKRTNASVPWDLSCDSANISDRLNAFSKWRDGQDKNLGLYHLVSGCSESETVGIAWLNQVCNTKSFKGSSETGDIVNGTSVSALIPNQFAVIAHEIGHNFGAIHDCDSKMCQACRGTDCKCCTCGPCDCQGKFVMHPQSGGLNLKEFSACSQSDVCSKLSVVGTCLKEPGRMKSIKKSVCGNGILEEGEECDCGSEAECKNNPCCSFGCKLKPGAVCSDDNEQCCSKCQFRKSEEAFKCFASKTRCQFDSICDGNSGKCPTPKKALDGSSCELEGGKCASGLCTSRDIQCRKIGQRLGITRACRKTPNTCQLICESSAGTCTAISANFMDGTPCGTKGTCMDGKCSQVTFTSMVEDNSTVVMVMGASVGALLFVMLLRALITISRR